VKIVLDTLGGDRPPQELIAGGVAAIREYDIEVVFAGDRSLIERELSKHRSLKYSIVHAPEEITMNEAPIEAVRKKKNSSLVQGIRAVRQGEADAFVSPANTGAVMAAALFNLGRLPEIDRPGIGVLVPTLEGRRTLIIDVGANAECDPEHLLEFGVMGTIYMREVLGIKNPRVGLLNIGEEPQKGDTQAQKAFAYLQQELPNFAGNVEPNRLVEGGFDVVVTDGFTGNICLKAYEGAATVTVRYLKREIEKSFLAKLGLPFLWPSLNRLKREVSAVQYGGAPLLGVRGVVIIAHGNSNAEAIKNAIRVAKEAVEHKIVEKIERGVHESLVHLGLVPVLRGSP
jgi:glycerol-3-phosphate acyltransferase PlsX